MANMSVSSLQKLITELGKSLEKDGIKLEIDCFRSGRHAQLGPSYVEVSVLIGNHGYCDSFRVLANGYDATSKRDFDTSKGWAATKQSILARIESEKKFQEQY